jgi:hypothetical protein
MNYTDDYTDVYVYCLTKNILTFCGKRKIYKLRGKVNRIYISIMRKPKTK